MSGAAAAIAAAGPAVGVGASEFRGIGWAVKRLQNGGKVAREGWNGKGLWLELQRPDDTSKMTLPYVFINYPADAINTPGARVPWLASQTDLLATDWMPVFEEAT